MDMLFTTIRFGDINYREGKKNGNADALSREPIINNEELSVINTINVDRSTLIQDQRNDKFLSQIIDYLVEKGKLPSKFNLNSKIIKYPKKAKLEDKVLYFLTPPTNGCY